MTEQQQQPTEGKRRAVPAADEPEGPQIAKKRYTVPDPESVSLGQAMGIKAATGIDVLAPESAGHQIAALLWFVGRADGLTFAEAMTYTARDFDVEDDDPVPDVDPLDPKEADDATDPTAGSDTPQL